MEPVHYLRTPPDAAAADWVADVRVRTYLSADDATAARAMRDILTELVDIARSDRTEDAARAVGARLAQKPFDQVRLIAPMVRTLITVAPPDPTDAQRWASIAGVAMDGYSAALRERSLYQQEQILAAAIAVRTSEVVTLQEQLRFQATHDSLTRLVNRAHLEDTVDAMLTDPYGLGLLIIDLDGFKFINDQYGHVVGDEVLAVVAERLLSAVAPADVVARYGGDEFVIATREPQDKLSPLAERVAAELREPFPTSVGAITIAASVGIAYHDGGEPTDFVSLLREADHAMYAIKAARRQSR